MPTGVFARSATPLGSIIAPIRVVIRNSQSLLGLLNVTCSWVGLTALASATTPIALARDVVHFVLTLLIEKTASSAVNGSPLLNFAAPVRSNV